MLLAGIALGSLAGAMTGLLVYMANDQQLRDLTFWGMGSLAGSTWTKIAAAGADHPAVLRRRAVPGPGLNAITLGEAAAFHMGVPVQRLKNIAIVSVAAATGASVRRQRRHRLRRHRRAACAANDHRPRSSLPAAGLGAARRFAADLRRRTGPHRRRPGRTADRHHHRSRRRPFFLWILLRQRSRLAL
jgi:iron complex transport system permease protein